MHRFIAFAAGLAIITFSSGVSARSADDRLLDIEKRIESLQRTYMTNNQEVASALARSQAVQQDFTSIKGEVESNRHLIKSQQEESLKLISELDHRIQAIEERLEIFSSQLSKALGKVAPSVAAEADLYQRGLDLVNGSKYIEAASTFEEFTKKYKGSTFAASAGFWIGECHYSMRDYRRAIKEFQTFIEKYPRDAKVPDALLKQGNSFYELGMPDEAGAFYDKIIQSYPKSTAAVQAQAKIQRIKERKASGGTPAGGGFDSYPTETLEQQRSRLRGTPVEPEPKPADTNKPSTETGGRRSPIRDF